MTDNVPTDNPFDSALNATETVFSTDLYGQIDLDMWYCTLRKGAGKQVFIPDVDRLGDRRTAVDINIADLGGVNYKRSFIAEIGNDGWLKVTLPSLKVLGVTDLKQVNGKYVHAEMVKYDTYQKKDGSGEGVKTAPKILAIYPSEVECAAAAQNQPSQTDWLTNPAPANGTNGASNPANEAEKQVAAAFLPAIVKNCRAGDGIDSTALAAAINSNPILARHFTLASPEVAQAMAAALAEPAF